MTRPDADRGRGRLAAFAGLAIAVASIARAAAPARTPPPFTTMPLPGGSWAAISGENGNAGFVTGSSGVLLVDPPAAPEAARLLLARIRDLTRRSPRWIVHTREAASPSQAAGDRVFTRAGASLAVSRESLDLGDFRVQISRATVHPGGDLVVFVSRGDVVFAGDLFAKEIVPDVNGADTDAWAQMLERFLFEHPAAYFVGSHGQPGRALDVRYLRDYLSGLRVAIRQSLARGESAEPLADRLLSLQRARFGRWTGFDARARHNIEEVARELKAAEKSPR